MSVGDCCVWDVTDGIDLVGFDLPLWADSRHTMWYFFTYVNVSSKERSSS
jgi:hypothetical protein